MKADMGGTFKIRELSEEALNKVLKALDDVLGIEVCFVSDETYMSDFKPNEKELQELSDILGVEVTRKGLSLVSLVRHVEEVAIK